jgi:hypothetical protein
MGVWLHVYKTKTRYNTKIENRLDLFLSENCSLLQYRNNARNIKTPLDFKCIVRNTLILIRGSIRENRGEYFLSFLALEPSFLLRVQF